MPIASQQDIFSYNALAVTCCGGGLFGYLRANSRISLVAGFCFGLSFAATAYCLSLSDARTSHNALVFGSVLSALLAARMIARGVRTRSSIPLGIGLASLYVCGNSLGALIKERK